MACTQYSDLSVSHPFETLNHAYKHGYTKLCDEAALAGLSRPRLSASETLNHPGLLLRWASRATAGF